MKSLFCGLLAATYLSSSAFAHDGDTDNYTARVDDHAPIGVMADHFHKKGDWMASARFMHMNMGNPISAMGPQTMNSEMVMVGFMYAPADWVTLMAGTGFKDSRSEMMMAGMMGGMPMQSSMKASGISDTKISALFPIVGTKTNRLVAAAALSLPTGQNDAITQSGMRINTGMQPGSGSYGFLPSLTYVRFNPKWSYGTQGSAKIWLDDNSFGERLGNSWKMTAWASYTLQDNISISTRLAFEEINPVKTSKMSALSGVAAQRLTSYIGANYVIRSGVLKGHRLALEVGVPISQGRGAYALEAKSSLMIGWQLAW